MKNKRLIAVSAAYPDSVEYDAINHGIAFSLCGSAKLNVCSPSIKGFNCVDDEFELNSHALPKVFSIDVKGIDEPCVCFCNNNNNPYILEGVIVIAREIESVNGIVNISIKDGAV